MPDRDLVPDPLKDEFLLGDVDERDGLIGDTVTVLELNYPDVVDYFDLSGRHDQRIASPSRFRTAVPTPASTSSLTSKAIETMARDSAAEPFVTAEEREAAFLDLGSGCPLVPIERPASGPTMGPGYDRSTVPAPAQSSPMTDRLDAFTRRADAVQSRLPAAAGEVDRLDATLSGDARHRVASAVRKLPEMLRGG